VIVGGRIMFLRSLTVVLANCIVAVVCTIGRMVLPLLIFKVLFRYSG